MFGPPTATSFRPRHVGPSPGCGWRRILDDRQRALHLSRFGTRRRELSRCRAERAWPRPQVDPVQVSLRYARIGHIRGVLPPVGVLPVPLPPLPGPDGKRVGFFPGSTIGNFEPDAAVDFLANYARILGHGGEMLIGVDLKKDPKILDAAYNDRAGVTAEFNLNLLERINRELDGDLDLDRFEHLAFYNE